MTVTVTVTEPTVTVSVRESWASPSATATPHHRRPTCCTADALHACPACCRAHACLARARALPHVACERCMQVLQACPACCGGGRALPRTHGKACACGRARMPLPLKHAPRTPRTPASAPSTVSTHARACGRLSSANACAWRVGVWGAGPKLSNGRTRLNVASMPSRPCTGHLPLHLSPEPRPLTQASWLQFCMLA